jgi:hypothetical protein
MIFLLFNLSSFFKVNLSPMGNQFLYSELIKATIKNSPAKGAIQNIFSVKLLFFTSVFIRNGQFMAPFCSAACQNFAAIGC